MKLLRRVDEWVSSVLFGRYWRVDPTYFGMRYKRTNFLGWILSSIWGLIVIVGVGAQVFLLLKAIFDTVVR